MDNKVTFNIDVEALEVLNTIDNINKNTAINIGLKLLKSSRVYTDYLKSSIHKTDEELVGTNELSDESTKELPKVTNNPTTKTTESKVESSRTVIDFSSM
jgi:hypothetical protein